MIPAAFDYELASSVDDAIRLLGQGEDAKLLAGGHSLLPLMKLRFAQPTLLVDIGRLSDLSYVKGDGDRIAIGALTRHHDVATSPLLRQECAIVADAAGQVGDPQVRHRGTIGGSVSHGDPASDLPTVLLALDAELVVRGAGGERTIPARDFFTGFLETALEAQDVLTEVRVPEAGRRRLDLPEVQPARAGLGDGRRRGRRVERLGQGRAHEHGRHAAPGDSGRGGARLGRGRGQGGRAGRRGDLPAERHERQRRLPQAPRQGAHPAGTRGDRLRAAVRGRAAARP